MTAARFEQSVARGRAHHPGAKLLAGAAEVEITPRDGRPVRLAGFGPERLATEVRDPLEARAVVLDDGRRSIALVSVDVIALLLPSVQRIRALLGRGAPDALVVTATHTHSAPDTLGLYGPARLGVPVASGVDPRWLTRTERRIALAVLKAARRLEPATVRCGLSRGGADLVVNIREPHLTDSQFFALVIERENGTPIANVLDFGCHAETLGPENTAISADLVADVCGVLERERGGLTLFLQGALGAMVTPAVREKATVAERTRFSHWVGDALGASALTAIRRAEPIPEPRLELVRRAISLPVKNVRFKLGKVMGVLERPIDGGGIRTEVGIFAVGPARFALLPGEPDPIVGVAARHVVGPGPNAVVALANDELGYLLTDARLDDPRYAYERTMSLGPGTAGRLLATLVDLERELSRRLT